MDVSSDEDAEHVDVSGDEDTEQVYFQQLSSFNESLDQSIDSLRGSLALPTFTVGQSTELQVSQGFQIFTGGNLTPQRSNDLIGQKVIPGTTGDASEAGSVGPYFHPNHVTTGVSLQGNALIFQGNRIGALNLIKNTDRFQFVMQNDMHEVVTSQLIGSDVSKYDANEADSVNETFEDCSSDEKSGKCKTSPKHRGRKSRSTSSTENEMTIKSEPIPGPSPSRLESQQSSGDMFRPTLLDEILTEKKLALMRSPEVISFLQSQQQDRENSVTHNNQSTNS